MEAILRALPLAPWLTVDTTPLSPHPSDPGNSRPPPAAQARTPWAQADRKVAVITGGSQGIGAALVAAYRRQGWGVVANARGIKRAQDPEVLTVGGDVAKPETAERIIGGALERFGRVDTLINNAGVLVPGRSPSTPTKTSPWSPLNLSGFFR